jgi:hypothetical protein
MPVKIYLHYNFSYSAYEQFNVIDNIEINAVLILI